MTERPDPEPGGPEPGGPESEGPGVEIAAPMTITRRQLAYVGWTMTLLAYIVVLNVWVEINDSVVIDSFAISIATAVVLLLMVVAILRLEHRTKTWFAAQEGSLFRVLGPVSTLLILFLSKFLILEVVDIIFGDHVELGGLLDVIVLVLLLIVSQKAMVAVWRALGDHHSAADIEIISE